MKIKLYYPILSLLLTITPTLATANINLSITIAVDTEVCSSGSTQCGQAGHTYTGANDANHNPIKMFLQVVSPAGAPIPKLDIDSFTFNNNFVPAGGGATGICSEYNCTTDRFQDAGNGLYGIFLDRIPDGNWRAGTYAGTVQITHLGPNEKTVTGTAMVSFTIPESVTALKEYSDFPEIDPTTPTGLVNPAGLVNPEE